MKLRRECGIWYHYKDQRLIVYRGSQTDLTQRVNPSTFLAEFKLAAAILACMSAIAVPIALILFAIIGGG